MSRIGKAPIELANGVTLDVKDKEVIKACDEHGISMAFTGMRHFRH